MKKDLIKSVPKNTRVALGAVALVIIVALLVQGSLRKKTAPSELPLQPIEEQQTTTAKSTKANVKTPTVVDNRAYGELVITYKDRMLQFGNSCQVHMNNQVYKVGSTILLDNRNSVPLSINIGSSNYYLGAYGYKVVTLSSIGNFTVDCNDHRNVATVTVQK